MKMYRLQIGEKEYSYPEGTTYLQVAESFQEQFDHAIVLVKLDGNKLQELRKPIQKDSRLEFITTGDNVGMETYKRSMCLMLVKAIYDVSDRAEIEKVRIDFSIGKGYYCLVDGNVKLTEVWLSKVEARMRQMIAEKMPIEKRTQKMKMESIIQQQRNLQDL